MTTRTEVTCPECGDSDVVMLRVTREECKNLYKTDTGIQAEYIVTKDVSTEALWCQVCGHKWTEDT